MSILCWYCTQVANHVQHKTHLLKTSCFQKLFSCDFRSCFLSPLKNLTNARSPLQTRKVTWEIQDLQSCGTLLLAGRCCILMYLIDNFGNFIHASVLLVPVQQPHLGLTAWRFLVCCFSKQMLMWINSPLAPPFTVVIPPSSSQHLSPTPLFSQSHIIFWVPFCFVLQFNRTFLMHCFSQPNWKHLES